MIFFTILAISITFFIIFRFSVQKFNTFLFLPTEDVTPHGHISPHSSDLTSSLDVLWRNMQSYYNSNPTGRQQNHNFHHFRGELVAVRLNLGGEKATSGIISGHRKGWFRAVVLADTDPDLDADQAPDVSLELVDYGAKVTKSSLDVTPLHDKFADDAPMVRKVLRICSFRAEKRNFSPFLNLLRVFV